MSSDAADLATAEGADRWFKGLMEDAHERFRTSEGDGDLAPAAYLVVTRDERNGALLDKPAMMIVAIDSRLINDHAGNGKDRLATWLRRVASRTAAIGFCFLSEAWVVTSKDKNWKRPKGSFEFVPGREEVLMAFCQHKALGAGTRIYRAPITRPKKGHATVGPWEKSTEFESAEGRFANVLLSEEAERTSNEALDQMAAVGADLTPAQRRQHIENVRKQFKEAGLVSPEEVDKNIASLINLVRERGIEIGSLPGDEPAPPRPHPDVEVFNVVNLSRETATQLTLETARDNLGKPVVYFPTPHLRPERGVIKSVNDTYVFVQYGDDPQAKATSPGDLFLALEPPEPPTEARS
jgi:hypothetical protein